jgi:hypothetical protein
VDRTIVIAASLPESLSIEAVKSNDLFTLQFWCAVILADVSLSGVGWVSVLAFLPVPEWRGCRCTFRLGL